MQQRSSDNITLPPRGHQLNILRDRFEVACQKASAEKCKRACYYATGHVCSKYDCRIDKKSILAKQCRAQCKAAYSYKDGSDNSDTDVDSDDSSHKSDDDSRRDTDFEAYINGLTASNKVKPKKKATKSQIDYDGFFKGKKIYETLDSRKELLVSRLSYNKI